MNTEKLVTAAREIDRLAAIQEARAKAWQDLASYARQPDADRREVERRRYELESTVVVDFGTAIEDLRAALHARPERMGNK